MLDELYKASNVPSEDWVRLPKDVLLVVPEKGRDVKPVLARLGLSKHEVAVTWPKEGLDMAAEWEELAPKVTIQLDQAVLTDDCEDFPVLPVEGFEPSPELEARVRLAMADAYVGLHHHDEFSIKDGLGTVEQLVKLLKAQRRSFCCVTNHGSVGGWIKQYNACKKAGVKAIFGMEAYVSDYRGDDPELKKAHRSANHLVLIARTKEGFDNIVRIHNDAQMHGFYYTPRVNREAIARWGKGIVGSSACMAGELPRALMEGDKEKAMEVWEFYSKAFDRFYVEIQVIEYEPQREANRRLIEFAREVGAPMLLTCDSHYLEAEHSETHDLLMCMRQGKTVLDKMDDQSDVWNFDVKNMYCRNADQMWEVFAGGFVDASGERPPFMDDVFTQEVYLEACENTRLLAGETEEIKLDSSIKLPKLYADGKKEMTRKVNAGFTRRWAEKKDRDEREGRAKSKEEYLELQKEYVARIRHEFGVITKLGWTDYFLVMERIISETIAKHGEWAIGYGRGSAAGSLISYCLGLTDVDPMEWGLMFERFLDEGRPDPPDIDTDFDPRVRDWVKQHIVKTFGADNVCSIGTYTTYRTRAVILDLARVLALDLGEASVVTKGIDPLRSFEDDEGEDTKVDKLSFDELESHYPELKAYFLEHPEVRRHAEVLRNQVKNMGMHAGGVIISDGSLKDKIPVLYDKPSNEERQVISAWAESGNASELSAVGLVKYDILGLNNLPVIADCCSLVKKHWPSEASRVQRRNIPINDSEAIKNGSQDDLVGIFQLESPATRPVAKQVGMESLEDVSAVTSLLRPGPKDMGMDKEYAERKHGKPYEMPAFLRELWKDTYGVLTYQEQAMKVSQALCGFTGPESNKLRKAIGKKLKDLMAEMKEKFIKGAQKRVDAGDITADEVLVVWNQVESFAGYGFNKSHAITYSAISTVELWLKYRYPAEFMTALINNTKLGKKKHGSEDVMVDYIKYARRTLSKIGVEVVGPDVNKSDEDFTIEPSASGRNIRFSIGHVKNVATSSGVVMANRPYASVQDFYDRVKTESTGSTGKKTVRRVNKKVVESLVAAGAFDSLVAGSTVAERRNAAMAEYYKARKEKEPAPERSEDEWEEAEKEAIGLCLSIPPIYKKYEAMVLKEKWDKLSDLEEKRVMAFGRIEKIVPTNSKSGNPRFDVTISDGIDSLRFMVFMSSMQYFRDNFKVGYVVAMPLSKFDEGNTRFFDDRGKAVVVDKGRKVEAK